MKCITCGCQTKNKPTRLDLEGKLRPECDDCKRERAAYLGETEHSTGK